MKPLTSSLETDLVSLRLVEAGDAAALATQAADRDMWQYFTVNLSDPEEMQKWVDKSLEEKEAGTRLPFTITHKPTGIIAGSMSIGNIFPYDLRAEIGWSWLGKDFRGTHVNRHAKFCMLRLVLEDWGYERVEFKTDVLNERAKKGLQKLGATEEGVLRSHMTMWNQRRRSSVYYSILKDEWPAIRQQHFNDIS